jgi:hypothetical protein
MKMAILALLLLTSTMDLASAGGTCLYKGMTYSDGARNDIGQVCDGLTGTWR